MRRSIRVERSVPRAFRQRRASQQINAMVKVATL
jgi:hypothetical protein